MNWVNLTGLANGHNPAPILSVILFLVTSSTIPILITWDGYYDILEDLQYAINGAATNPDLAYFGGAARVLKAYVYQMLVDMYGNVPYTDALKGLGSLAPKFDDQKAIYEDLIKVLDTAITVLKANPLVAAYAGSDIVFGQAELELHCWCTYKMDPVCK